MARIAKTIKTETSNQIVEQEKEAVAKAQESSNKFLNKGKERSCKHSVITPESAGLRLVLMPVDMANKLQGGIYKLLSKRWVKVKEDFKYWFAMRQNFKLGQIVTTAVQSDTWIIHMLCLDNELQVNEKALKECMKKVYDMCKSETATVHVSDLIFQEVPEIKSLLDEFIISKGINIWVYEEPNKA